MTVRTVALASDHAGYELKAQIVRQLEGAGYSVLDLGTDGPASVDYPDFAAALAAAVTDGRAQRGVLICGSGIGISIAANRHPGIRAALVHDVTTARLSREHNDANVIALGARVIGPEIAKDCVDVFLKTDFEGGERHSRRIAKMG
ncbi:ribose 5-phosphate isomerase B [Azospirillum sp. B506]|uniref:ribose 5-phosphate isomerase B n=1 Tax=Azospirillum sp. B506 TaxID=137721 RepID=UPI00034897B8|nr:ribose 5-phosphate isomerase B [Azospirillum sp. B506]